MTGVTILHEAEVELWEAVAYYDERSPGLGLDFETEIERSLEMINAATQPLYGGAGSNRWTRMNGSDLSNAVNVVYPLGNPTQYPVWHTGHLADHTNQIFTYIQEMAALATQTVSLCSIGSLSSGAFQFQVSGVAGESYVVPASPELTNWVALQTNKRSSNIWTYADLQAPNFSRRFYRAKLAP